MKKRKKLQGIAVLYRKNTYKTVQFQQAWLPIGIHKLLTQEVSSEESNETCSESTATFSCRTPLVILANKIV